MQNIPNIPMVNELNEQQPNLITEGLNKVWNNLFNGSFYILGISALSALMCLPHGLPFLASAIIDYTIKFGFLYSSLEKPFSRISKSIRWSFSDLNSRSEELEPSSTERGLAFLTVYYILNFSSFLENFSKSILSLNLMLNPLVQGIIFLILNNIINKTLDSASNSFLKSLNLRSIQSNLSNSNFMPILISLSIGIMMAGFYSTALINPFISATLLDGFLKFALVSIICYFPGNFTYNILVESLDFILKNCGKFWDHNDENKLEFKKDTFLGEFFGTLKELVDSLYNATLELIPEVSLNDYSETSDEEIGNQFKP